MRWLDSMFDSKDMNLSKPQKIDKVREGQRSLAWCSPWGCKQLDRTWQLNNNNNNSGSLVKSLPAIWETWV